MFQNMDRALRQQIMGTAKDNFIRVLNSTHLEYSRSNILNLLTHPYATYVVIMNFNCIAHDKCFREANSPTDPIKFF